ncbi:Hypothetical protein I5071_47580 [Sandaracinus amylolyticus]|nr:Hypothetical protein I5071_47580 [Sandaracinus amylolyticus]
MSARAADHTLVVAPTVLMVGSPTRDRTPLRCAAGSSTIRDSDMAIHIVPHDPQWKMRVDAFNTRMREGGSQYGFYVDALPVWLPKRTTDQPVWREYWLAVEDGEHVRAGYALKPQAWWIHGQTKMVADWQGPFSEGAYDNRYGALGLRLFRDMLKKQPLLFSWGHGGDDAPVLQLLNKLKWTMIPTPFLLRVVRPFHFARKNKYLREQPRTRLALDLAAFSGAASIGGRALHAGLRLRSLKRFGAKAEVVSSFGPWADALWERAKHDYDAIAVRDARVMNTLLPEGETQPEWSEQIRLRVRDAAGEDLGWAVVCVRDMKGHHRYGDCRVGTVVDYLAPVANAGEVIHAAFDYLRDRGAELVIANQADPRWVRAFEDNGFVKLEGKRLFCAAPPLAEALENTRERFFVSNMDGHGPMGL